MKRFLFPVLLSLGLLVAAAPVSIRAADGDGWLTALERHVRSGILHNESEPFDYALKDTRGSGLTISGERIHLEGGILTAHFDGVTGDDGSKFSNINSTSHLSLGGDFLTDPIRKTVEAMLAFTDATVSKVDMAFTAQKDQTAFSREGTQVELLSMPARDVKMTFRDRQMEMHLHSILPVKCTGTASYRAPEKKIDIQLTGAWSGPFPIPPDLVFSVLSSQVHYPFVEIHKPYVTLDLGYFLNPAPAR